MATAEKGTLENPYTMAEYEELEDSGMWQGGYVIDDDDTVSYVLKDLDVIGYSGYSGYGSSGYGSSGYSSIIHGSDYNGSIIIWNGTTSGDNNNTNDSNHNTSDGNHNTSDGNHNTSNGNHNTSDGNHNTSDGNHNTSGDGDGHNTNNSQTPEFNVDKSKYNFLHESIIYTKKISKGIHDSINLLGKNERLIVNSLMMDEEEQKHAQYDEKNHILYVASDSSIESLIHELIHYYQDEEEILSYEDNASNNEYQAEFLTQLIDIAKGFNTNLASYNYEKYGYTYDEFVDFCNFIRNNSRNNEGEIELKNNKIDVYMDSIPASKWNERMDSFVNYYRNQYPGDQYETHKKDNNPNYQWSWSKILNRMEFKRY